MEILDITNPTEENRATAMFRPDEIKTVTIGKRDFPARLNPEGQLVVQPDPTQEHWFLPETIRTQLGIRGKVFDNNIFAALGLATEVVKDDVTDETAAERKRMVLPVTIAQLLRGYIVPTLEVYGSINHIIIQHRQLVKGKITGKDRAIFLQELDQNLSQLAGLRPASKAGYRGDVFQRNYVIKCDYLKTLLFNMAFSEIQFLPQRPDVKVNVFIEFVWPPHTDNRFRAFEIEMT